MSTPPPEPPAPPPPSSSGVATVLRYTGIPQSWIRRPKLPSRNWLVFLSVTSSLIGLYVYDRRQCREIRDAYARRVEHLAQKPMKSTELPRKVTVYACRWPGDDDYNRALKHFKKYVKPMLVAAAIDYDVVTGRRHGDLARELASRIKEKRRIDAGLQSPPPQIISLLTPEQHAARQLAGGSLIIGRQTFKEYMEGLRRGWTEPPVAVDREEVIAQALHDDGRFDEREDSSLSAGLEGEPEPTTSRLQDVAKQFSPLRQRPVPSASEEQPTATSEQAERLFEDSATALEQPSPPLDIRTAPAPDAIPPQPPLLLVPFTNYLGFTQIPLMIYDFFNRRALVRSGAEAGYRLAMDHTRPIDVPASYSLKSQLALEDESAAAPPAAGDLSFGRDSEAYYKNSLRKFLEDVGKARAEYYKELPKRLETTRALARGDREPTKDERNHPPPSEVELRAERMKKELRWQGDEEGWEIVRPEREVVWDERFRNALRVFEDPPDDGGASGFVEA